MEKKGHGHHATYHQSATPPTLFHRIYLHTGEGQLKEGGGEGPFAGIIHLTSALYGEREMGLLGIPPPFSHITTSGVGLEREEQGKERGEEREKEAQWSRRRLQSDAHNHRLGVV